MQVGCETGWEAAWIRPPEIPLIWVDMPARLKSADLDPGMRVWTHTVFVYIRTCRNEGKLWPKFRPYEAWTILVLLDWKSFENSNSEKVILTFRTIKGCKYTHKQVCVTMICIVVCSDFRKTVNPISWDQLDLLTCSTKDTDILWTLMA